MRRFISIAALIITGFALATAAPAEQRAAVESEFVFQQAPFPQCHASTLAEGRGGLVAAWFGGTREKAPDVGIWVSRKDAGAWTAPVEVANGLQPTDATGKAERLPCWNPVLHQVPRGPLLLFYKVGPSPDTWWGMLTQSRDGGNTWDAPRRLPEGILGPIKDKPLALAGGRLLCPSSTEHAGWKIHFEATDDNGKTWERGADVPDPAGFGPIQPTLLRLGGRDLMALCRSRNLGKISWTRSADDGRTWLPLKATSLPNPNSGIDGVTLRDGRQLLVYNHTPLGRSPLNVAVSRDGEEWMAAAVLEKDPGEYSYPAVIQTADGLVHITYTWQRRRIRHVTLDPARLEQKPIVDGRWPS